MLFSNYMQPKLRTSMCCVPYVDPNFYIPDSKAIEDALVEILETRAYHCIDDHFRWVPSDQKQDGLARVYELLRPDCLGNPRRLN